MTVVISDTSPLSNLALVDSLFLLKEIYTTVVIPQTVAEELENGRENDSRISAVLSLDWIEVKQATDIELISELRKNYLLDKGEAEAIALALELKADELLIDERLGRQEATRLGLAITGVLGILLVAKSRGLIPAIRPLIDDLIEIAGFRVSNQLYQEVLIAASENIAD